MFRRLTTITLIVITAGGSLSGRLAHSETVSLRIPRVSRAPRPDDFLTGRGREAEARVTDFRQYEPGDGVPASQKTTAYLSYDDKNLYVVFDCKDDPGKIRARMAKREDIESDDKVVVNLDTFHDRQHCYSFRVNPLGIQLDGIFTEGQGSDDTFDTLWHSDGRIYDQGYIVWIAIPFRSLRFRSSESQSWGIALGRTLQRNNEMSCWPYVTQRIETFVGQFAVLEGLERISPGRNMQLVPYWAFSRAHYLDPLAEGGPAFAHDTEVRPGLDAKFVLRNALTLDVALNPDFSQVESDEPQVTVNQRFEVFFPEKRPFFLENAGFFQTPIQLFFSRRIADPQFGARITGKVGRWNLGAIAMDDRAPGEIAGETGPVVGGRAGIGIVRVQREFRNESSVGFLATSRDDTSGSNRVYSVDTRLRLNPNWALIGQLAQSDTRQSNGVRQKGPAAWAELSHNGRHLVYASRFSDRSPDFHTDLGFIPRVDIRQMEQYFRYYWRPRNSLVALFGPDVTATLNWNRQGQVQDWIADVSFGANLKGPTGMGCRRVYAFELYQGRGFRKHATDCGVTTQRFKWLEVVADLGWGPSINYYPASGSVPSLANATSATFSLRFRPNPRFRCDQSYIYSRLGARSGSSAPAPAVFNNHILRTRLNYQFTRPLSVRAIIDYNAALPNPSLVNLERTKRLTADVLVTFLLNPGTALYLGFTDRYENLFIANTDPRTLARTGMPDTSTGRQFFVKLSYLWRL
jgi:hypothetical protein